MVDMQFLCLAMTTVLAISLNSSFGALQDEHKTLAIGSPAPDFSLPDVNGKTYTLASFSDAHISGGHFYMQPLSYRTGP